MLKSLTRIFTDAGKVTIVSDEPAGRLQLLVKEIEACGAPAAVVPLGVASSVRTSLAYLRPLIRDDLTGIEPGFHELRAWEGRSDRVVNTPSALQIAHHLVLTGRALERAGVRHAAMRGVFEGHAAPMIAEELGFPLLLRPPYATGGRCSVAVHHPDGLRRQVGQLITQDWFRTTGLVLQRFVPNAAAVSALVVEGAVVGATQVMSEPDPARGTVGKPFTTCPAVLSASAERLAVDAVRAVGGDVMAAHLLFGTGGDVLVGDVNGSPDLALYETSAVRAVARSVVRRYRRRPDRIPERRRLSSRV